MVFSPQRVLSAANLRAKRRLGQNFLTDAGTAEKIASHADIGPEDTVLEIGAGLGGLTVPLAQRAKKVFAVEKDRSILAMLESEIAARNLTNVTVVNTDFLIFDLIDLAAEEERKILVVGNLPYNISSQVLVKLVMSKEAVSKAVLMFQKELARRITAGPGNRNYGRITVMLKYCSEINSLMTVGASVFYPRPKVDSELVEIRFKQTIDEPDFDEKIFHSVIKAAFSKRRKTLKNSLTGSPLFSTREEAVDILQKTGIDPERRAETLTIEEFANLSKTVTRRR